MQLDESLLTGVAPGKLKQLFAAGRAVSSRGPSKAKLFLQHMIHIGEDGYVRSDPLTNIMHLPLRDRRKAANAFLRGDTPLWPPARRDRQLPPWNAFDGLLGSPQAAFERAPLHALLVSGSYIAHAEAMSTFP